MSKNVVIIELGGSHAECLHAQIHYLSMAGYNVHVICDEVVRTQIAEEEKLTGIQIHKVKRGVFASIATALKIHAYIRRNNIRYMVVNTVEVDVIRYIFLLPLSRKLNCTGILHNANKLLTGRTLNRIIGKRMKKFFVLGDYIRQKFQPQTKYRLEVFYPIYFPVFGHNAVCKPNNEMWIAVPGAVEPSRRAYVELLQGIKNNGLRSEIKLFFLGKFDVKKYADIQEMLEQTGLLDKQIIVFPDFLDNLVFHGYMRQSDLILPLMHSSINGVANKFYGDYRISGSFNLSYAYKIPMLLEQSMQQYDDFKDCSFFYTASELVTVINAMVDKKQELGAVQSFMQHAPQWQEENLLQKYIRFVES